MLSDELAACTAAPLPVKAQHASHARGFTIFLTSNAAPGKSWRAGLTGRAKEAQTLRMPTYGEPALFWTMRASDDVRWADGAA